MNLIVSYNPTNQGIDVYFSKSIDSDLSSSEKETMILIKEYFDQQVQQILGYPVDKELMFAVRNICLNAINYAYQQTGIKFELDDKDLVFTRF